MKKKIKKFYISYKSRKHIVSLIWLFGCLLLCFILLNHKNPVDVTSFFVLFSFFFIMHKLSWIEGNQDD